MTGCDYEPDPVAGIRFECRQVATCPHCGPSSPTWPAGDLPHLREMGVPVNVVETAELADAGG